jgi:hypothetical protein
MKKKKDLGRGGDLAWRCGEFTRTCPPARRVVSFVFFPEAPPPRLLLLLLPLLGCCCRLQPAPVPTSEKPFEFFRHSEIFDVSREAVPADRVTLQGVFERAIVAEVHPRHEVREGGRIGDGEIDDGMIRGGRQQSREPRCYASRDGGPTLVWSRRRDLGRGLGLSGGVDQIEWG